MIIENLEAMKDFAHNLSLQLKNGDVINLIGEMGAGKTTLTGFITEEFNIDNSASPTFAIVNIYDGDKKIYHLDLYRFEDKDDILDIDYEEYFYPVDAITFIEWADNAKGYLPLDMINIQIDKIGEDKRKITILDNTKRGAEIDEYFSN